MPTGAVEHQHGVSARCHACRAISARWTFAWQPPGPHRLRSRETVLAKGLRLRVGPWVLRAHRDTTIAGIARYLPTVRSCSSPPDFSAIRRCRSCRRQRTTPCRPAPDRDPPPPSPQNRQTGPRRAAAAGPEPSGSQALPVRRRWCVGPSRGASAGPSRGSQPPSFDRRLPAPAPASAAHRPRCRRVPAQCRCAAQCRSRQVCPRDHHCHHRSASLPPCNRRVGRTIWRRRSGYHRRSLVEP